jgi:mRNA interferase RelE/StbE
MQYVVDLTPHARRALKKLPQYVRETLDSRIEELSKEPRPAGCKKLQGSNEYRLRAGKYRLTYVVDDAARTVMVTEAGLREHFYG